MMGDPHLTYPVVHVTGTNGKTSTTRMVTAIGAAHGLKTGYYTSPHLQGPEERFGLNLEPSTPEQFSRAIADAAAFDQIWEERRPEGLTYFEFLTAAALAWFADEAVELAAVEVGLGGRLDATNVVQSRVAVVTAVALEHTEYLGDTLEAIAAEKAAILEPGQILVTGSLPPPAASIVEDVVKEKAGSLLRLGDDFRPGELRQAVGGWLCDIEGVYDSYSDLLMPVHGRHQVDNLAVAVGALEAMFGRSLEEEAIREGVAALTLPGRLEAVGHFPLVVLDGAHTPHAAAVVAATLAEEFPPLEWEVVFGVLGDKDVAATLEPLRPLVGRLHAVAARSPRAVPAAEVATAAGDLLDVPVVSHDSVAAGVDTAVAAAGENGGVLVTGSFYVAGEARDALAGREPPLASGAEPEE